MSDNVVNFPKNPNKEWPVSVEEANERVLEARAEYIEGVMETLLERVTGDLMTFGMPMKEGIEHEKDWFFFVNVLESMLYRNAGIHHFIQPLVDDIIRFNEKSEEIVAEYKPEKPKAKRGRKKKAEKTDEEKPVSE